MNTTKCGDNTIIATAITSTLWRWEVRTAGNRLLQAGTSESRELATLDGVRWSQATEIR